MTDDFTEQDDLQMSTFKIYRVEITCATDQAFYSQVETSGIHRFRRIGHAGTERLLVAEGFRFADGTYVERWFFEKLTLYYDDDRDTGFGPQSQSNRRDLVAERIYLQRDDLVTEGN